MDAVHLSAFDAVVLLLRTPWRALERDAWLIDGQILGMQCNVLCILQHLEQDLHSAIEAQIFGVLQMRQHTQIIFLRAQSRGQAIVAITGAGDGIGAGDGANCGQSQQQEQQLHVEPREIEEEEEEEEEEKRVVKWEWGD